VTLESGPSASPPARALDLASDWGVLVYAVWTLIAYGGMLTDAKVSLLVPIWLAASLGLVGVVVVLSRRSADRAAPAKPTASDWRKLSPGRRRVVLACLLAGLASGILVGLTSEPWALVWAGAAAAAAAAVWAGRLTSEASENGASAGWVADAVVVAVGLTLAIVSLFLLRANDDNAFYFNRATATAELDRIPVKDVLFTDELVGAASGIGLPVDTFSALQGALARFLGIHAVSVGSYLFPPLFTFLAVWALWRLLRAWAPRSALLCFALGSVYWLFSAQASLTAGSYFVNRMYQGKVVFVAWLVLTVFVHATRWLSRRDAFTATVLVAAGVTSIGLTSSATFAAPLLFATLAVPLVARRDWRGLPVLVTAAAIPFLVGTAVAETQGLAERLGGGLHSTSWYFDEIFGVGLLAAVGLIALLAAPWLARAGPPARLTTAVAVVSMLLLAPGLIVRVGEEIGIATTLRRVFWIIPFPALVGLLAAFPLGAALGRLSGARALPRRLVAAAPALLVAALLFAFGAPFWFSPFGVSLWVHRPAWKVDPGDLADARAILARYRGEGPILAKERVMRAIAQVTSDPKAVNPRSYYLSLLPASDQRIRDREVLTSFIGGRVRRSQAVIRRGLSELQVGLVCVDKGEPRVRRDVERTGLYTEAFRVRGLTCFERSDGVAAGA
jgi:Family of unknown function (DUF6077)